jgi:hypothetical protein
VHIINWMSVLTARPMAPGSHLDPYHPIVTAQAAAHRTLLASHQHGHLFVAGCKINQGKLYSQFDHIALLSAPVDVLLARIAARTSNPYGKHPGEQALILRHLAEVEPMLRATATIEIDATAPLSQVVRQLEDLT